LCDISTALVEKSVQHVSATLPFKLLSAVGCDRHMEVRIWLFFSPKNPVEDA